MAGGCPDSRAGDTEYDVKGMPFRTLGSSGLRVPLFSLGTWSILSDSLDDGVTVKNLVKTAFDNGINMFDTAEGDRAGDAEVALGRAIRELGYRRSDLIISTKVFWWRHENPNGTGLSRKHIVEGIRGSLERLGMQYVDIVYALCPDSTVPMEEIVRAFDFVINQGWAHYWGTTEWSTQQIEEAYHAATKLGLIGPVVAQCKYSVLQRDRLEREYTTLYRKYNMNTAVFVALTGGLLTTKENDGLPPGSSFAIRADPKVHPLPVPVKTPEGQARIARLQAITDVAKKELECELSQLALAWTTKNPNISSIILGPRTSERLLEGVKALEVVPKLTCEMMARIEDVLGSWPGSGSPK